MNGLTPQRVVHELIFFLGQWSGHAVGGVKPGQGRHTVDTAVLAVDKSFPTHILKEREFDVAPFFHMLADVVFIIAAVEFNEFISFRINNTEFAVIKIYMIVIIH